MTESIAENSNELDQAVKSARNGNDGLLYLRKGAVVLKRSPKETAIMIRKVADLIDKGMTTEAVAQALGVPLTAARYYRSKGMRIGIIPRARSLRKDAKKMYKRGPYKKLRTLQPPPAPPLKMVPSEPFALSVRADGNIEVTVVVTKDRLGELLTTLSPFL